MNNSNGRCFESLFTKIFLSIGRNTFLRRRSIARVKNFARALARAIARVKRKGLQSWTLSKEMEKRIKSFEFKCYRHILQIPYTAHVTNEGIKNQINAATGTSERLIGTVRKRKVPWFGHKVRQDNSLTKMIMEEMVEGTRRRRGRREKLWIDSIRVVKLGRKRKTEQWRLL